MIGTRSKRCDIGRRGKARECVADDAVQHHSPAWGQRYDDGVDMKISAHTSPPTVAENSREPTIIAIALDLSAERDTVARKAQEERPMTPSDRPGPLKGLKVIELAHVMAGPVCGLMLADMGADVIKVEKINGGDDTRRQLPPDINGESAAYMMMNRNKRGVVIDLKHADGKDVLRRLVKTADVLIENYRADTLPKLGLGYEDLTQINPGLIYAAISGFGRTGPLAEQGGFDLIAQGMSGLMSITGEGPGRPAGQSRCAGL